MDPQSYLKKTADYLANLEKAKRSHIAVGLPKGQATAQVYGDGQTVVDIGTYHEFGLGVPRRSFLADPFKLKKVTINKYLLKLFKEVFENGADAEIQLEKAGVLLQNISKEAFETNGFGTWKDITEATKAAKGSSAILIDTGILRGSITYEVR
jgi:hypothetical protein